MKFECGLSGFEGEKHSLYKLDEISELFSSVGSYFFQSYFDSASLAHRPLISCHLTLVNDESMREINKNHRGVDKTTDVLSFPIFDDLRNDAQSFAMLQAVELGDIYISHNVLMTQAKEFNLDPWEELIHLYIHGFLHLAGFDHELSASEQSLMEDWENKILHHCSTIINH